MILPSKHLPPNRALLSVGARVLQALAEPRTASATWDQITRDVEQSISRKHVISYDTFVLSLDLLFMIGAIEIREGVLRRIAR